MALPSPAVSLPCRAVTALPLPFLSAHCFAAANLINSSPRRCKSWLIHAPACRSSAFPKRRSSSQFLFTSWHFQRASILSSPILAAAHHGWTIQCLRCPSRVISSPPHSLTIQFLRLSIRCFASADPRVATLILRSSILCSSDAIQGTSSAFRLIATPGPSTPRPCGSSHAGAHPQPFLPAPRLANALLIGSRPCLGASVHIHASADIRFAMPCPCGACPSISLPSRSCSLLSFPMPLRRYAIPLLSLDMPSPFSSCRCSAFAVLIQSVLFRGHARHFATSRFRSDALPASSLPLPSLAFPLRCHPVRASAYPLLSASRPCLR